MPLGTLQHYTIEPSDLERTKEFYCGVLGLENGDRPPLDFPGYWLYSGGTATVHLWIFSFAVEFGPTPRDEVKAIGWPDFKKSSAEANVWAGKPTAFSRPCSALRIKSSSSTIATSLVFV